MIKIYSSLRTNCVSKQEHLYWNFYNFSRLMSKPGNMCATLININDFMAFYPSVCLITLLLGERIAIIYY